MSDGGPHQRMASIVSVASDRYSLPMSLHRKRLRRSLRTLWVGLLALALVIQPALAGLGELHELDHAMEAGAHAVQHDVHGGAADERVTRDDGESGDPAHLLLHSAHCCAQTTPTLDAREIQVFAVLGHAAPAFDSSELRLKASANDVLRPPIG